MTTQPTSMLQGTKEIAGFAGRSWRTVEKLIRTKNFPARMIEGRWESDTELITRWRRRQIEDA